MTIADQREPRAPRRRVGSAGDRLLDVKGLSTSFRTRDGVVRAVDGVNFHVDRGEILPLDPEYRDIGQRIGPDQFGRPSSAICKNHSDLRGPAHHVMVGDDVPVAAVYDTAPTAVAEEAADLDGDDGRSRS